MNYKEIIAKSITEKISKKKKLNVAFLIFDERKWKSQSVYDLLEKSEYFVPYIFVSRYDLESDKLNYTPIQKVKRVYNFFKNKNMRVKYAYDFKKEEHIPLKTMKPKPDMVIYCDPWNINKFQYVYRINQYAFSYYLPYSVPASSWWQEYNLEFHSLVGTYYVLNDVIKEHYASNMQNEGINLKVVGHPTLDYFYLNKNKVFQNKKYVIYAPHFSIDDESLLKWGSFLQIGEFMLDWAKKHTEFVWIYRPHPALERYLLNNNYWSEEKYKKYLDEWNKVGFVSNSGDYLDLFMESTALITDCGSFKTEYFMTKKPQFYPVAHNPTPFNADVKMINNTCYSSKTVEELENNLNEVLVKGNDYKKEDRLKLYKEFDYENHYCARKILKDLETDAGINKISIILSVNNNQKQTEKCIKSILNQDYTNLELIIRNKEITDSVFKIIEKYQKTDKRIKIINKKNINLKQATDEVILYINSENILKKDVLRKINKQFYKNDCNIAYFNTHKYFGKIAINKSYGFNFSRKYINGKLNVYSEFEKMFLKKNYILRAFNKNFFIENNIRLPQENIIQNKIDNVKNNMYLWNKIFKKYYKEDNSQDMETVFLFETEKILKELFKKSILNKRKYYYLMQEVFKYINDKYKEKYVEDNKSRSIIYNLVINNSFLSYINERFLFYFSILFD